MGTVSVLQRVGGSLKWDVTTAGGTLRGRGLRGDGDGDRGEATELVVNLCTGVVGTPSWDGLASEERTLFRLDGRVGISAK